MKRIIAGIILSMLVWSNVMPVHAIMHTCAYSYRGTSCYSSSLAARHPYMVGGEYRTCEVVSYYYRDTYACACGKSEYRNLRCITKHTALCGQ